MNSIGGSNWLEIEINRENNFFVCHDNFWLLLANWAGGGVSWNKEIWKREGVMLRTRWHKITSATARELLEGLPPWICSCAFVGKC